MCGSAGGFERQLVRGRYFGSYPASTDHCGITSQVRMQTLAMALTTMAAGTQAASVHASCSSV